MSVKLVSPDIGEPLPLHCVGWRASSGDRGAMRTSFEVDDPQLELQALLRHLMKTKPPLTIEIGDAIDPPPA